MTEMHGDRENVGLGETPILECPSCGHTYGQGDFLRDQVLYRCAKCRVELSSIAVMKLLYAGEEESPFAQATVTPTPGSTVPLFRRDGFLWVMVYFVVSAGLLFVGAQTGKPGMAQVSIVALVAHAVAAGALWTRSQWGLYVAYAFLGGRALVGLLSGAPAQPFGIAEQLANWAAWAMAVVAPIAALAWLAINSHYFGPRRP